MAKLIINNSNTILSYPVISDSYANLKNALDIWIKFTSYLKPEEILLLEQLENKNTNSNETEELDEYLRIKKQLKVSKLLLKYKNKECNKEEHDYVLNFMRTSLKSFIQSRLTNEEQELSFRFISELETNDKLKEYVELHQKEPYEKLSIYNSYVLFNAKERLYYLEQKQLNEKITNAQIKNSINLRKNLVKDFGRSIFY